MVGSMKGFVYLVEKYNPAIVRNPPLFTQGSVISLDNTKSTNRSVEWSDRKKEFHQNSSNEFYNFEL